LAENPRAKPLDHTKESQRFVRNVCELDIDDMRKVSAKCFPKGDQELQIPDKLSGKVLVDRDKGVVGYCLYDDTEKHVDDMAVLPEYREDANKSSFKLSNSVMKDLQQKGGEWVAELRDTTSLRLLQMMEKRGIVHLEVGEVDHTMSDGTKVYEASFRFLSTEERNAYMQKQAAEKSALQKAAEKQGGIQGVKSAVQKALKRG
jgi:hypothetical protein